MLNTRSCLVLDHRARHLDRRLAAGGTTLESEMGPAVTKLLPYYGYSEQFGMLSAHDGCVIRGLTIRGVVNGFTIYVWGNGTEISGNIIDGIFAGKGDGDPGVYEVTVTGTATILL